MTENKIIEILQTEKACVTRAMKNECNRDCYNCVLCEEGKDILTVYDAVIKALEEKEQYRAIGTIDEFKALKEKNTPKELAEHNFQDEVHHYLCPSCRSIVSCNQNYCEECGQALET